jgi:hypothetical protein
MLRELDAARWREAGTLFHELVALDEPSRSRRLTQLGHSDPELRAAVETLLAGDAIADKALPSLPIGIGNLDGDDAAAALGLEGERLGRFRVIERIAWGGMGVVYSAEDTELHRTVALKFPLLHVTDSARAITLREARSAGALDHPNLCPIYDVVESERGPFFVMPLYRGETLKERIARAAPLDASDVLAILEQLASGLACAHGAGIVHCDIKPGNVMLLADGTAKLLDFGLARAAAADISVASGVVGTIGYMAPEQIRNDPVDARADLWALGVILYEMLSGLRPFAGDGSSQIARAVLDAEPRALAATGIAVAPVVQALVSGLLAKEPRARIQTAAELVRLIASARADLRQLSSRRRARRRVAAIGGILGATGVLATALWLRPPPSLISSGKLAPRDTIVFADFDVAGLDSNDGRVLDTLVRGGFADSKGVTLMGKKAAEAALARMRRPPGTSLTPQLARELALREDKRAVLSAAVAPIGDGYVLTLRLIESESGKQLAFFENTVADPERELLPALALQTQALRERIGEPERDARSPSPRRRKPLTTSSLEAARLLWRKPGRPRRDDEKIAAARAAIKIDSSFAYAWMDVGNMLSWTHHRSALLDSALGQAYRLRGDLSLFEQAQVGSLYWWAVQRDRRAALAALESALARDSTIEGVVPLNITEELNDIRDFKRTEAFARQIERWKNVGPAVSGALVWAQVAQGEYAAADSTIARFRALRPNVRAASALERIGAISRLHLDSAEAILNGMANVAVLMSERAALHRLRGRLAEAHKAEEWLDSSSAASAAAAGARLDSTSRRTLSLAREALWIRHDSSEAIRQLNGHWGKASPAQDIQDRVDGMQAAGLYAAVGRVMKADSLVSLFENGADTIAKRSIYEHRQAALAEIALARRNFVEALHLFRASDLAADGLPATRCSVCVLPHLARVAERAGWSDSARVFWEGYVTQPAIERLNSDQWFLPTAYSRLATLASQRGDLATAAAYRRSLASLRNQPR